MTAIAVNQCRRRLRKRKLRQVFSLEQLSPRRLLRLSQQEERIGDIVHSRQRRQSLWDLVDELPERLRLPLLLRYRYGLACGDISTVLGLRTGTIYQQLHEGRNRLQRMAAEQEEKLPAKVEMTV